LKNYKDHTELQKILDSLRSSRISGKLISYLFSNKEESILEGFRKVLEIEKCYIENCCIVEEEYNPCFLLPSFKEIKKDFYQYNPNKTPIKELSKLKEIAADLKKRKPETYWYIPTESIETEILFENNQDFLYKLAILLKQIINELKENELIINELKEKLNLSEATEYISFILNISPSEATEYISFILDICIENKNKNPSYNSGGREAPKGFSHSTIIKVMKDKDTFGESKPKINNSKEGNDYDKIKDLRKKKKEIIIPHLLKDIRFDPFIEYFNKKNQLLSAKAESVLNI
jgi:hypothetical protein